MNLLNIRSLLFTPANKPERFEKAKIIGADGLIIDLEDSVTLADKDEARRIVIEYLKSYKKDDNFIQCLRINSLKTPAGIKDLTDLIDNNVYPDAIMLPKSEYAAEFIILDSLIAPKKIPYLALIETSKGLFNAKEIAASSTNLQALVFGGADLAADLRAKFGWEAMFDGRCTIVKAAATMGLAAFDVPYLNLKDTDDTGILNESERVKNLGYTGKLSIHPKHINAINKTFSPTDEEFEKAKKIVDIYESSGGNACEIDGKMIDVPVYKSAKRIVSLKR